MKGNVYSELADMMREAGESKGPAPPVHLRLGTVLSAAPLKVDVAGRPQEAERFYISHRLTEGHRELLGLECSGVSAVLPESVTYPGGVKSGCTAEVQGGSFSAELSVHSGNVSASGLSGSFPGEIRYPGGVKTGCRADVRGGTLETPHCYASQAEPVLKAGDTVLLLTEDDQIFYILDKVVRAG